MPLQQTWWISWFGASRHDETRQVTGFPATCVKLAAGSVANDDGYIHNNALGPRVPCISLGFRTKDVLFKTSAPYSAPKSSHNQKCMCTACSFYTATTRTLPLKRARYFRNVKGSIMTASISPAVAKLTSRPLRNSQKQEALSNLRK